MNQAERDMLLELSEPDDQVIQTISRLQGDLLLLGAAGKVGHALALMAKRALAKCGGKRRVIAVSRFSTPGVQKQFEDDGITTIAADVGDSDAVEKLPDASDVVYLVGQKFGTAAGNQATTWLLNAFVPGVVCRRWKKSRIAAYSSGNVYKFYPAQSTGPREDGEVSPIGEYAWSVLGRERVFEAFSRSQGTPVVTIRLNYANEPRYGVLVDVGRQVLEGKTIDLTQGYANVVWAADANRVTLKSLELASSPPSILNLAGPKVAVREAAQKFGKIFNVTPSFTGAESPNALLNDGSFCWQKFGPPQVGVDQMIQRIAGWLKEGHSTWNKPTHFEVRDGKF